MKFSANLGFLWTDRALPDAIRAASAAGFDAVELHWPYETDPAEVRSALDETGLPCLGLNTPRGDTGAGENGLSALPGREGEARAAIEQALDYAVAIDAANVHVMAGVAEGPEAEAAFIANLQFAAARAGRRGILIEPLNHYDAPGYFLNTATQAARIVETVGDPNVKIMFDCYHIQLMQGDLTHRLRTLLPAIGHIQIASVPDRGTPDHGELNYSYIYDLLGELGWQSPLGAEYKVATPTDETLDWLRAARG
ncbi:hydroxypyruvate isomerase family protein [Palleronia sp. LCG004]|uniref:hydroxypyruvate isomerase family protein n=1 Tax=Palleronia sp. LCG004 TaxID=3079304 RepID=UPI002941C0AC|nr:TIM barrel protein [Palleronia sp. LCG004]WOI55380.1 TIM barrel protein [Palleronia sp. LCG004]